VNKGKLTVDTLKDSTPAHPSRTEKTSAQATCAGCRAEYPRRVLVEVLPERHDSLVFFDGDKVCRSCARRNGVEV